MSRLDVLHGFFVKLSVETISSEIENSLGIRQTIPTNSNGFATNLRQTFFSDEFTINIFVENICRETVENYQLIWFVKNY